MLNNKQDFRQQLLFPPKTIINDNIYIFLYSLIKYIFLANKNIKSELLNNFINIINKKIIKVESKYITKEYNTKNLKNIFSFIQSQSKVFASDILEGLLIIIFSSTFNAETSELFEKLIIMDYKGINKLFMSNNYQIINLFNSKIFFPEELQNLKNLLENEDKYEEKDNINNIIKDSPFYNLLHEIKESKLVFLEEKIKNLNNDNHSEDNKYLNEQLLKEQFKNKKLIRLFLISVCIYYQNKKLLNKKEISEKNIIDKYGLNYLSLIPFNYKFENSNLTKIFSETIFPPIKIEPRISEISLSKNNLEFIAFFELTKTLIFNKNIEKINLDNSKVKYNYLEYFNFGFGIFDNYTLKELSLSCTEINKDSELFLAKLISHLKGLKIINLSMNNLNRGVASFFILLKELYAKNEINLETLLLNSCHLDNSSFYELGELLKSPYCKLKKLCLNMNSIPDCINFFKKLKQNKSLEELYLNKTNINDNDINDIMKLIRNTHIQTLYLYNNLISNFDDLIRIIYTTKVIKYVDNKIDENNSKIINDQTYMENLDLSENKIIHKNEKNVKLLFEIKNQTNLSCLDLSHILYGKNPDKYKISENNKIYRKEISELCNDTEKDKEEFINNNIREKKLIVDKTREIEEIKNIENNFLKNYDKEIMTILRKKISEYNFKDDKSQLNLKRELKSIIFDLAEINAIEHKPMYMSDYVAQLDSVLTSGNRKILDGYGKISHEQAIEKAKKSGYKIIYKCDKCGEVKKNIMASDDNMELFIKIMANPIKF